jgi:hypoxanthine phosphoribosyltransferase
MAQLKDSMVPFMTEKEISELVKGLAREIERDYAKKEIVLVCPLKGSVTFTADLCRALQIPTMIDFVHLTSPKGEGVRILKDISLDITGKHVLICEEIIDYGRTLSFLRSRLLSNNPASLRIVALLDKPSRRALPIKPDYVGRTIDDRFVVGYGLDSEELGRNYPALYNYAN